VGRPDLAQHVIAELTQEKLAGHLFDSLRNKIMPLPDHLIVYPGHGAGSACGKKMSSETQDTLGHQKAGNYALRPDLTKEEFVREVLDGLTQPPSYFPKNVLMNMKGYKSFEEVMQQGISALNPLEFKSIALAKGALIVDTRHPDVFRKEFIPGSINIGLDGNFAVWAGTLIPDIEQPILIVAEEGREKEVVSRLSRVGYDHTIGYLKGGIEAWKNSGLETDFIASVSAAEFSKTALELPETSVLDVRRKAEFEAGHLTNASNIPLDYINQNMEKIERNKPVFVHCAGGYRSVIFISILQARGFRNFINVEGGFLSIQSVGKLKSVTEKVEVV
jgi:rhodanese-related sulfurtransferase